jgi:hypothetical protein
MTDEIRSKMSDQKHISEGVKSVTELVDQEAQTLGGSDKVFLGGLGHGGSLAIASYLHYD